MPTEEELLFVDQVGRYFARQYFAPPITGRVVGWLLVCDPPHQTAAQIAEALRASRSAVGSAVTHLEHLALVERTRIFGERADRVAIDPAFGVKGLETPDEFAALAALARRGLELLGDEPPSRRARLLEMAAFADFLLERSKQLADEWRAHRAALIASGELPANP
jgi:hypothetical protein